jgi:hypothetical protein
MYVLNKEDYNKVFELSHKIRFEIVDGLHDLSVLPRILVQMVASQSPIKEFKRFKVKGPLMNILLEATEKSILDTHLSKLEKIMEKDATALSYKIFNPELDAAPEWGYNLKTTFQFFQASISPMPSYISMATCHKVPISQMGDLYQKIIDFSIKYKDEYPPGSFPGLFASMLYFLPNGNYVVLGGIGGQNVDGKREKNMNIWHKKTRSQVRYGGAHYWLGESISQSIVEADAYTPDFLQFFKDMKKTVDPNYLLSPNKFHLYNYEYDTSQHIVKDD